MSEKKKLKLDELKNKKSLKKIGDLSDEALEGVNGGYWEDSGYAEGFWIECPKCHKSNANNFTTWADNEQCVDQFICKNCGTPFAVDEYGWVYF